MPDLSPLKAQGREHWNNHLPSKYARLKANGTLEKELAKAANQTDKEMAQLMKGGLMYHEAWEAVREKYLILPAEPD